MSELLDYIQTSGNDWSAPVSSMLHESVQEEPKLIHSHSQRAILDGIEQQMACFYAEHDARIVELRKYFIIDNEQDLRIFLRSHRTLAQLLLEAVPYLGKHFGAALRVTLRTRIDESGAQTLYAVVMWTDAADHVRAALARFDDDWWLGVVHQAAGCLTFTYELI